MQFNDADIITNAADIELNSSGAGIIDQFGNNALRHLSHITVDGSLALTNTTFTTSGDFTNDGIILVSQNNAPAPAFTVTGSLTNYSAGILSGGTYAAFGGHIVIPNADITSNAAIIAIQGPGQLTDQNGQDALRHFAHNLPAGDFKVAATTFNFGGSLVNEGQLSVFGGLGFPSGTLGRINVNGDLANSGVILINVGPLMLGDKFDALTGGTADLHVTGGITNSGTVRISQGSTLSVDGAAGYVQTSGSTEIQAGSITASKVMIQGGALAGNGTVNSDVTVAGVVEPNSNDWAYSGTPGGQLSINGHVTLTSSANTTIDIFGSSTDSSQYGSLSINGVATLGGALDVSLLANRQNAVNAAASVLSILNPDPSDQYVILSATSLEGQFSNAPDGSRLFTSEGSGSFLVDYLPANGSTPAEIVLTDFQAVPEPASISLCSLAFAGLLCRRRHRR